MSDTNTPVKLNNLALIGFISAFFIPIVGLICSIIGLSQVSKSKQRGKGLAISGIVVSVLVALAQLLTLVIIIAAVNSNSVTLTSYRDSSVGYTVKYPEGWTISPQNVEGAKGVMIKKDYKNTGKSNGQVEVGYFAPPANGYSKDILDAIASGIKQSNQGTTVIYENRTTTNGLDTLTLVTTYNGETGKVKAKTTVIKKADNSVFVVATQAPQENWGKYQDSFDEIHNTFNPN